jgi:uncharacterized protein YxjI
MTMYVIRERMFRMGEDSDITDQAGQTVATVSKRWMTVTDSYTVDVAPGEGHVLILVSVLALDLALDAEHDH